MTKIVDSKSPSSSVANSKLKMSSSEPSFVDVSLEEKASHCGKDRSEGGLHSRDQRKEKSDRKDREKPSSQGRDSKERVSSRRKEEEQHLPTHRTKGCPRSGSKTMDGSSRRRSSSRVRSNEKSKQRKEICSPKRECESFDKVKEVSPRRASKSTERNQDVMKGRSPTRVSKLSDRSVKKADANRDASKRGRGLSNSSHRSSSSPDLCGSSSRRSQIRDKRATTAIKEEKKMQCYDASITLGVKSNSGTDIDRLRELSSLRQPITEGKRSASLAFDLANPSVLRTPASKKDMLEVSMAASVLRGYANSKDRTTISLRTPRRMVSKSLSQLVVAEAEKKRQATPQRASAKPLGPGLRGNTNSGKQPKTPRSSAMSLMQAIDATSERGAYLKTPVTSAKSLIYAQTPLMQAIGYETERRKHARTPRIRRAKSHDGVSDLVHLFHSEDDSERTPRRSNQRKDGDYPRKLTKSRDRYRYEGDSNLRALENTRGHSDPTKRPTPPSQSEGSLSGLLAIKLQGEGSPHKEKTKGRNFNISKRSTLKRNKSTGSLLEPESIELHPERIPRQAGIRNRRSPPKRLLSKNNSDRSLQNGNVGAIDAECASQETRGRLKRSTRCFQSDSNLQELGKSEKHRDRAQRQKASRRSESHPEIAMIKPRTAIPNPRSCVGHPQIQLGAAHATRQRPLRQRSNLSGRSSRSIFREAARVGNQQLMQALEAPSKIFKEEDFEFDDNECDGVEDNSGDNSEDKSLLKMQDGSSNTMGEESDRSHRSASSKNSSKRDSFQSYISSKLQSRTHFKLEDGRDQDNGLIEATESTPTSKEEMDLNNLDPTTLNSALVKDLLSRSRQRRKESRNQ